MTVNYHRYLINILKDPIDYREVVFKLADTNPKELLKAILGQDFEASVVGPKSTKRKLVDGKTLGETDRHIIALVEQSRKLDAIKFIRDKRHWNTQRSQNYVNELQARWLPETVRPQIGPVNNAK